MATVGIDYASVDGGAVPDFKAARAAGIRFAIPRAIYGRRVSGQHDKAPVFIDPVWARDKDAILAAGLKRGAYLFLCYEKAGVQTPSPEVQVQSFFDYVKLDPKVDFVPWLDVEEASLAMTGEQMYEWTLRAASKFVELYGTWPGIYTSARVWSENLKSHSPGPLLNCPLWLAKPWPWLTRTPLRLDGAPMYQPKMIPEWSNQWFVYQYQGDGTHCPGFTSTVDGDRFRVFGKGSMGAHVAWTQHRLGITADGIFGDKTEAAVKDLQKKNGLAVDGIVGVDTFMPLAWTHPV